MDRKTVRAILIAVVIFFALDIYVSWRSGPQPPDKPRNGIIGWLLRNAIWHTIWGEEQAPDEPKRNTPAEPPRRSIAGGQEIPDFAEGW